MKISAQPGRDLFRYLESPRNYKGELRPIPPRWIYGRPQAAAAALKQMAPPHVRQDRQRWTGHCQAHLTHVIVGFSEGHEAVRPLLPFVLGAVECLVLAGLPPDALEFVFCEHPQPRNSHVHCALPRVVLPAGQYYALGLSGALVVKFCWSLSRRLGLSDPLSRPRLVRAGEFSYKGRNRKCIDAICDATRHWYRGRTLLHHLSHHENFLRLLRQNRNEFGIGDVVVLPDPRGRPLRLTDAPLGPLYWHSVGVEGPDSIIWLAGPVCRCNFDLEDWSLRFKKLQAQFQDQRLVSGWTLQGIKARIHAQQSAYAATGSGLPPVGLECFEWLKPDSRFASLSGEELTAAADVFGPNFPTPAALSPAAVFPSDEPDESLVRNGPESAGAYFSDLSLLDNQDIAVGSEGLDADFDPAEEDLDSMFPADTAAFSPPALSEVPDVSGAAAKPGASAHPVPVPRASAVGIPSLELRTSAASLSGSNMPDRKSGQTSTHDGGRVAGPSEGLGLARLPLTFPQRRRRGWRKLQRRISLQAALEQEISRGKGPRPAAPSANAVGTPAPLPPQSQNNLIEFG